VLDLTDHGHRLEATREIERALQQTKKNDRTGKDQHKSGSNFPHVNNKKTTPTPNVNPKPIR
jgi:hypothetical protein